MIDASSCILVLNAGSSSLKFALYDVGAGEPGEQARWRGKIDGIGGSSPTWSDNRSEHARALVLDAERPFRAASMKCAAHWQYTPTSSLRAVAHRVVHGGSRYFAPTRVNADVLEELRRLIPLAPLHQPSTLEGIESFFDSHPDVPQIACFDTGFHHGMPLVEQLLPLPYDAWERGLRRYGFHGLSYEYQSIALVRRHGDLARGRVLVAHIGNGASLCAMRELRSVATTMGFGPLSDDGHALCSRSRRGPSPLETGRRSVGPVAVPESGLLARRILRSARPPRHRSQPRAACPSIFGRTAIGVFASWSPPASASTTRSSARASAPHSACSASASTMPPTAAMRR
jgi:acetate kinase